MNRLQGLVLAVICVALAAALPASAGAEIKVSPSDSSKVVDSFFKGKCIVRGKKDNRDFFLSAISKDRKFLLSVFLDAPVFEGFRKDIYEATYGGKEPQIFLRRRADDKVFSNYKLPGTPAGEVFAGGVTFRNQGKRVGIGLFGAIDQAGVEGYTFAGPISCKYKFKRD